MELAFWICLGLIAYPYAIYPALLVAINRITARRGHVGAVCEPTVSIILPVHNEAKRIEVKIRNLLALDYPRDKMQVLVVGDACTDDTLARARLAGEGLVATIDRTTREGKAAALNAGVQCATGEIVVFTDAAIMLERGSLRALMSHFNDPRIGCVSGEDYIEGEGTEGLYGRLELLLRREEAKLHSIAGASGCFYAQRRELCLPFRAGMAPDFLSVLVTVKAGRRALAEPAARGFMTATSKSSAEFTRKVRTFLRGITALFGNASLLVPLRYPGFSFVLWSHKVLRWLAPAPMVGCLVIAAALIHDPLYQAALWAQLSLYGIAVAGLISPKASARIALVRLSAFFVLVNAAAALAFGRWLVGDRQEVWEPTRRP